jgi:hypothetical protein
MYIEDIREVTCVCGESVAYIGASKSVCQECGWEIETPESIRAEEEAREQARADERAGERAIARMWKRSEAYYGRNF